MNVIIFFLCFHRKPSIPWKGSNDACACGYKVKTWKASTPQGVTTEQHPDVTFFMNILFKKEIKLCVYIILFFLGIIFFFPDFHWKDCLLCCFSLFSSLNMDFQVLVEFVVTLTFLRKLFKVIFLFNIEQLLVSLVFPLNQKYIHFFPPLVSLTVSSQDSPVLLKSSGTGISSGWMGHWIARERGGGWITGMSLHHGRPYQLRDWN